MTNFAARNEKIIYNVALASSFADIRWVQRRADFTIADDGGLINEQ